MELLYQPFSRSFFFSPLPCLFLVSLPQEEAACSQSHLLLDEQGTPEAVGFKYSRAGNIWVLPLSATVLTTGCPTEVGMASSAQRELPISVSAGCLSHLRVIWSKHIYCLYFFGEFRWRATPELRWQRDTSPQMKVLLHVQSYLCFG